MKYKKTLRTTLRKQEWDADPKRKEQLSLRMKEQWSDPELRRLRSQKISEAKLKKSAERRAQGLSPQKSYGPRSIKGCKGTPWTDERKKRQWTPERRDQAARIMKDRMADPKFVKKIRERSWSEEAKLKRSKTLSGRVVASNNKTKLKGQDRTERQKKAAITCSQKAKERWTKTEWYVSTVAKLAAGHRHRPRDSYKGTTDAANEAIRLPSPQAPEDQIDKEGRAARLEMLKAVFPKRVFKPGP